MDWLFRLPRMLSGRVSLQLFRRPLEHQMVGENRSHQLKIERKLEIVASRPIEPSHYLAKCDQVKIDNFESVKDARPMRIRNDQLQELLLVHRECVPHRLVRDVAVFVELISGERSDEAIEEHIARAHHHHQYEEKDVEAAGFDDLLPGMGKHSNRTKSIGLNQDAPIPFENSPQPCTARQ